MLSKTKQFKAARLNAALASPDCAAKELTLPALQDRDADNVSNDEQSTNGSENRIEISGYESREDELKWQCEGNCSPKTVYESAP